MDYRGANGCYKMFTQGQVARMVAALQSPSRVTLWQTSNLVATGLLSNAGITELEHSNFVIYPNPANDILTIEFNNKSQQIIRLVDITGHIIFEGETNEASEVSVNVSSFSEGMYTLLVQSQQKTETKRLIIKK